MRYARVDHWQLSHCRRCIADLVLHFGVGWGRLECRFFRFRDVCYVPVYRVKTGHLIGMDRIPGCELRGLSLLQEKERLAMAITRFSNAPAGGGVTGHMGDADLARRCPLLHEYMTAESFPDGELRQGATVMLFSAPDGWKCLLNERDQELNLWSTGESFDAALLGLEALLSGPACPWRRPKGWKPPVAKAAPPVALPGPKGNRKK